MPSDEHLDNDISYTQKKFEHIPYSFAYYIKCSFNDQASKFKNYTGVDCHKVFIDYLERDVHNLYSKYLKVPKKMTKLTNLQKIQFEYTNECHICEKPIISEKVADLCHLTGFYRGPAHSKFNLNFKGPNFFPVIFH